MRARNLLRFTAALQAFLLLATLFLPALAAAAVSTDQADYSPGSVVTISGDNSDGAGYLPGETVDVVVSGPNGYAASCSAVADDAGAWSCQVTLWNNDLAVGDYFYTANGRDSHVTETGSFTDARNWDLTFAGTGSGSVTITPSSGTVNAPVSCGGTGSNASSQTVTSTCTPNITTSVNGATVTLTATASVGSAFSGWSAPMNLTGSTCAGTTNPCSAVFGSNAALTVSFAAVVATTTSISAPTITYDANGSVTVTVSSGSGTPTGNVTLSVDGGSAVSQSLTTGSATFTDSIVPALVSPSAGDHTLSASYAAQNGFEPSSATGTLHVDQAASTTVVSCPTNVTYTGSPLTPCTATVTGAGGLNQAVPVTYGDNTNAGTATASYTYAGDANHYGSSDLKNFEIDRATTTTVVTCPSSVTYDGSAQEPCNVLVTGAGGLSLTPTPGYSTNINAGTATASYTYAGDANHTGSSDSKNFTIDKATTTTTVVCPAGPYVYNGSPQQPCSASWLSDSADAAGGPLAVDYTNNTNAGTAGASAAFAGDANHTGSSDSKNFTIDKATTTTTVVCPAGPYVYNGSPQQPCSASWLSDSADAAGGPLAVDYTNNTNAGTAGLSAAFAGDANHYGSSDSDSFEIGQRPITIRANNQTKLLGTTFTFVGNEFTISSGSLVAGRIDHECHAYIDRGTFGGWCRHVPNRPECRSVRGGFGQQLRDHLLDCRDPDGPIQRLPALRRDQGAQGGQHDSHQAVSLRRQPSRRVELRHRRQGDVADQARQHRGRCPGRLRIRQPREQLPV